MVFVKARRGDTNDAVVRKFIRKVTEERLMQQIKDLQFFHSASEVRKERSKRRRQGRRSY